MVSEEGDITLTITDDEKLSVDDGTVSAETDYNVDKKSKVFTVHISQESIREQAEESDGAVTEEQISDLLDTVEGTYDYNIEGTTLTLSEREYGSQMIFEKE